MMRTRRAALVLPVLAVIAGCASTLSGLDGSSDYACKAPAGVTCQSVSGVYANAAAQNLPAQRQRAAAAVAAAAPSVTASAAPAAPPSDPALATLRSPPRILRLWFKPWEDADHDLFDQGYVYVQVDGGRWLVEHARRGIREAFGPVRAPIGTGASAPPPTAPSARRPGAPEAPLLPPLPRLTTPFGAAEPNE